jgi:serine/threonine protein kinase
MGDLVADRYRIERELGRGGMAVAYAVYDTLSGRTLALKRLLQSSADANRNHARLFEQEFLTLQQLSHPCVVEVYDFRREEAGGAFYTMEWLDGGDLLELSPLPYRRLCALLSDVASALSLLHSRRLVHGCRAFAERRVGVTV